MQFMCCWSHWWLPTILVIAIAILVVAMATASTTIIAGPVHLSIHCTVRTFLLLVQVLKHSLPSVLCSTLSNGLDPQAVGIVCSHGDVASSKNCVLCQLARMFPIPVKIRKQK